MKKIVLDGSKWKSEDDVYDGLLPALDSMDGHGRNLDALWDSVSSDQLNGVRAPFEVYIRSAVEWPHEVDILVQKINTVFDEANQSGTDVRLVVE